MRLRSALLLGTLFGGLALAPAARADFILNLPVGTGQVTASETVGSPSFIYFGQSGQVTGGPGAPVTAGDDINAQSANFQFAPVSGTTQGLANRTVEFLNQAGTRALATIGYYASGPDAIRVSVSDLDVSPSAGFGIQTSATLVAYGSSFMDTAFGLDVIPDFSGSLSDPPVAVPEPASLAVLASGVVGVVLLRSVQRRKAASAAA